MSQPGVRDRRAAGAGRWPTLFRGNSILALLSRFSVVGILATLTYLIVANAILLTGMLAATSASVIAYGAGMIVSFLGQSRITFRVEAGPRHALRFVILSVAGFLVSYLSVDWAVRLLGVAAWWGTLATAALIPLISFVVMKLWVFAPAAKRA